MQQPFEPSTLRPQVAWAREGVQPPAPLYIHRDDAINIESWGSLAGANIAVRGRILLPDGTPTQLTFNHTPTTDRTRGSTDHQLPECWLLNLLLVESGNVARLGQLYARANLVRGPGASALLDATLAEGYVANFNPLWWPGSPRSPMTAGPGALRSVTGTDPAAGVEIVETVPTNARWRLIAISAELVTAVAAANRTVRVLIDDGASVLYQVVSSSVQTASLTWRYTAGAAGAAVGQGAQTVLLAVPTTPLLLQAFRVRTSVENLQAADNWGAPQLWVEEWIEE